MFVKEDQVLRRLYPDDLKQANAQQHFPNESTYHHYQQPFVLVSFLTRFISQMELGQMSINDSGVLSIMKKHINIPFSASSMWQSWV